MGLAGGSPSSSARAGLQDWSVAYWGKGSAGPCAAWPWAGHFHSWSSVSPLVKCLTLKNSSRREFWGDKAKTPLALSLQPLQELPHSLRKKKKAVGEGGGRNKMTHGHGMDLCWSASGRNLAERNSPALPSLCPDQQPSNLSLHILAKYSGWEL